jgi:hypothetical protein
MVGVTQIGVVGVNTVYCDGFMSTFGRTCCFHFRPLHFVQMGAEVISRGKCVDNVGLGPIRALEGREAIGLVPSLSHLSLAWCQSYSLSHPLP